MNSNLYFTGFSHLLDQEMGVLKSILDLQSPQGGAPSSYKLVINPLTIDISPTKAHSYWSYVHQLSYPTGAPPCMAQSSSSRHDDCWTCQVVLLTSSEVAFTALRADGTVLRWGHPYYTRRRRTLLELMMFRSIHQKWGISKEDICIYNYTGWWFGTFFIFPNSWDDDPI